MKKNYKASGIKFGSQVPVKSLLEKMGPRKKLINYPTVLLGHYLYISVKVSKKAKEPWILASNIKFQNPIKLYKRRWEIETLFGCLKTRGFRLEDTHMTATDKIEKLLFILAIAFCWAYKTGEIRSRKEPIKTKNHGRKELSVFRLGFNLIRSALYVVYRELDIFLSLLDCFLNVKSGVYIMSK